MNHKILGSLITLFIGLSMCGQTVIPSDNPDYYLQQLINEKGIIGVAAGYSIDGTTRWKNSLGYSNLKEKINFTDSTKTRIASISKPMTAIAIMQLVEQGLVNLAAPIQTYLPDFPIKEKGSITISQLLSHTSGFPGYQSSKETESLTEYPRLADALNVIKDRPLLFTPGTAYYYTTYGYVILGRIIEEVSGESFETYMQKNIWNKADMRATGIEKFDQNYPNKSALYHRKGKKAKLAKKTNLSNRIPGGGFYSTLQDMLKFGNAVVNNSLIKKSTLDLMMVNQFKQKEGNPYGYGWFMYAPPPNENLVIGHSGEQTGAATQLMIIPNSKTVVIALSNTSGAWKDIVTFTSELIRISELKK